METELFKLTTQVDSLQHSETVLESIKFQRILTFLFQFFLFTERVESVGVFDSFDLSRERSLMSYP